jgi:heptosyltransferase-1
MKRILIVKLSSMGDVLHALPVLSDIKQALGDDTQIDWVAEPNYACLLKDHPYIHQLHTLSFRQYKGYLKSIRSDEARQLKQFLKNHPYDAILDLQGLLKSAWVCRWAKGIRYGYDSKSIREPWASWFYHQKFPVSKNLHAITRMRELAAKALGYEVSAGEPSYGLNTKTSGSQANCIPGTTNHSEENKCFNKEDDRYPQLILFPFTTWGTKHWPTEHWHAFINLAKNHFHITIAWGSQNEYRQAQSFCENTTNCQLTPDLNVEGMKNFLKDCDAFIGVDTGFAHLATAMNIPGIVLMGPTDKNESGPLGNNQLALDVELSCRPCHKRVCSLPIEPNSLRPKCLARISPEFVLKNLQKIL